ncbi:CFI-box-CTERM domain-containing protein [Mesorhizobium sp.]
MSDISTSFCFIATALCGKYREDPIQKYLDFRDHRIAPYAIGRFAIRSYYYFSPFAARFLTRHPLAMKLAGSFFTKLSRVL